jgi:hypothetical protein
MNLRFFKLSGMAALLGLLLFNVEARAQICGYSINTLYVVDDNGRLIDQLKIEPLSSESYNTSFHEHFDEATKIYRDERLSAYVMQHGLCGPHRGVLLQFSAAGFEPAQFKVEMPLEFRGYKIDLKKKGNREKAALSEVDCMTHVGACVRTVRRDY